MRSEKGLIILAFPCNNFGSQEPGTNLEITKFAKEKSAVFPLFAKLSCEEGDRTHPLYGYLRAAVRSSHGDGTALKWNFEKFLCDSEGVPVRRYLPHVSPMAVEQDIKQMLL